MTDGGRTPLPRQRTLRATLAWSHDLLTQAERVGLRRLPVGGVRWRMVAGEAVGRGVGSLALARARDDGAD